MTHHEGVHPGVDRHRKRRVCPDCGDSYYNEHAHLEECLGRLEFAGYYRCDRCGEEGRRQGNFCPCGGGRVKVMQEKQPWAGWPKDAA